MAHFLDEVQLTAVGGKGGNGCRAFRREKFIPYGGPAGGNGGKGGDIIFRADQNINTLIDYSAKKYFRAEDGNPGQGSNKSGACAEDRILKVPVGTMIYNENTNELLADLENGGDEYIAAHGGIGGKGNANFVSSTRQAPSFAETGEKGEEIDLRLELRLVADVGIIGFPSVGKSTLIAAISSARPKIADYEFTTLVPNLGVVKISEEKSYVVCDIPGLIKGASEGKGLGHAFLKHIKRCRILLHLIDPLRAGDAFENYEIINRELEKFDKDLSKKKQILAINKADAIEEKEVKKVLKKFEKKGVKDVLVISAVAHIGLDEIKKSLYKELQKLPKAKKEKKEPMVVLRPQEESTRNFEVKKEKDKVYRISGKRIEQIAEMTPLNHPEGFARMIDVLHKVGAVRELKKQGAKPGDLIKIGEEDFEFIDWS